MHASFVEVHNEYVRDLIAEPDRNGNQPYLKVITRDKHGNAGTEALESCRARVPSSRALTKLVEEALARRVTEGTDYNEHSSRSHALLTLELERRVGGTSQKTSILLVDLAGSETYARQRVSRQRV